jgi:Protein of unknown function (DUF1616)
MRRVARNRDLIAAAAASLASLGLMALPVDGLVKELLLVPLVLFIPGYALSAAMFPAALGRSERLVYSISLSVAAAALGGLVWQLAFGLERFSWAAILTAVTLTSCAVALRRRVSIPPRRIPSSPRLTLPGAATVVGIVAAVALAVFAVGTATEGLQDQRAESNFTALWIVPARAGGTMGAKVRVSNHQGAVHQYRLLVTGAGQTLREWDGRLGARQQLQLNLGAALIPTGARLVASLYRDGTLYRRVKLQTEVGA